jgi:hypothetical protein
MPISRDRDCHSLARISEILGGCQRFGMHQSFDHFKHGGPVQKSRYSTGESPPIKPGHREIPTHLETSCTRFNTSARRSTRPSVGPERSQLLRILLSLTVRQFFSDSAYFFLLGQYWRTPSFLYAPRFLDAPMFLYIFAGAYIFVYFMAMSAKIKPGPKKLENSRAQPPLTFPRNGYACIQNIMHGAV